MSSKHQAAWTIWSLSCFPRTWSHCVSLQLSGLRLDRTTDPPTGHAPSDLLTSEGWKLHPHITLSASIFEHAKAGSLVTPAQNDSYYTFIQLPVYTLPTPQTALFLFLYPINNLSPLPPWRQIWHLFTHLLAWLTCENPLLAANLGVSAFWLKN